MPIRKPKNRLTQAKPESPSQNFTTIRNLRLLITMLTLLTLSCQTTRPNSSKPKVHNLQAFRTCVGQAHKDRAEENRQWHAQSDQKYSEFIQAYQRGRRLVLNARELNKNMVAYNPNFVVHIGQYHIPRCAKEDKRSLVIDYQIRIFKYLLQIYEEGPIKTIHLFDEGIPNGEDFDLYPEDIARIEQAKQEQNLDNIHDLFFQYGAGLILKYWVPTNTAKKALVIHGSEPDWPSSLITAWENLNCDDPNAVSQVIEDYKDFVYNYRESFLARLIRELQDSANFNPETDMAISIMGAHHFVADDLADRVVYEVRFSFQEDPDLNRNLDREVPCTETIEDPWLKDPNTIKMLVDTARGLPDLQQFILQAQP